LRVGGKYFSKGGGAGDQDQAGGEGRFEHGDLLGVSARLFEETAEETAESAHGLKLRLIS
jgi:hypothetical protein